MAYIFSPDDAASGAPHVAMPLGALPSSAELHSVVAVPDARGGRSGLRVELTDEVTSEGVPGVDYIDQPTFVLLPVDFANGTIEVDLFCELRSDAPEYARGFAGIAYRVSADPGTFESVYLRPLNGSRCDPPAPRRSRAVQYFVYPEWPFDRLRERFPGGEYEAGADIGSEEWIHFSLRVEGRMVVAVVNGEEVLRVTERPGGGGAGDGGAADGGAVDGAAAAASGGVGLWVDIGSSAVFSNLVIRPTSS